MQKCCFLILIYLYFRLLMRLDYYFLRYFLYPSKLLITNNASFCTLTYLCIHIASLTIPLQIINLSDLECDYINARVCCERLNKVKDLDFIECLKFAIVKCQTWQLRIKTNIKTSLKLMSVIYNI